MKKEQRFTNASNPISPLVQSFLQTEELFQSIVERSRQVDCAVQSTVELAEFTVLA
jgi:hypothetical protein